MGQTTTTTAASTIFNATMPTPVEGRPSLEIDVFPRANTTYNYTEYLPVVFAFQNMNATLALGNVYFQWAIMPYGTEDDWILGGIWIEDPGYSGLETHNVPDFFNPDGSPYFMVNSTNTTNWNTNSVPSNWPGEEFLYSLRWYLRWSAFGYAREDETCVYLHGDLKGDMFFTMHHTRSSGGYWQGDSTTYPNPRELGNVTGNCAQFGGMREINVNSTDLCEKARVVSSGNPCTVKPDAALVSSMSSVAALRAQPTPTRIEEPSSSSAARAMSMPGRAVLVLAGIIGGPALPI
ncbi:uncharacterized protein CC84DRAFT_1177228 [Paraphaeosphaeria sporulosa]|uniref:DUF7136 domain-containing protein n=1 Tax=Paraphaeosphaeria sporulosa TaxID=1460663 RepID=A0A177CDY4_9PLEO|nr:uncharacterized protein CC84DRAFT_1177228 [Paraphaeosphaeria sporulosa]OAG05132.1 hypothetical protein CC84DRAFT_1177228 [Paraphaeosphaeria sporulosa]